jgi:hypothetical protein
MIKRISLKTAGIISVVIALITIAIHTLVILKVMSFAWINGGRSETFEIAKQTSTISIMILIVIIFISLWACEIIHFTRFKKLLSAILWIYFAYACIGIILQFLGTPFERFFTSILCIINAIAAFRLAIEKR